MPRARRGLRSVSAAPAVATPVRCAIYTRKSTDEGLDRGFNSLDNQRERAEAYIASQENWTALDSRYDDGGFSGGNTERPALKRLIEDAEDHRIDTILTYRLDRISRSLADFVQIHAFLEKHEVALVSVTESINTQTPHGRMMVNVLLSFAQYERELGAERTRHKIEAARRNGKWTGGMPPLGYDTVPEGGRLIVNADEADQVRAIFDLYLANPALVGVAQELTRRGWRRKSWTTKDGKYREGKAWCRVTVQRLLRDPIYAGLQKLGDETFPGDHPAIIKKKTWTAVQALLDGNRQTRGAAARNGQGFLLRGLMRCSACDSAMTPSWTKRRGKMYRYYTCSQAQKRGHDTCPTKSIAADQIEEIVVAQVRRLGADENLLDETFRTAVGQVKAQRRGLRAEKKRLTRDLADARQAVERLVGALSRTDGAAGDAVAHELAAAQERVQAIQARQTEIKTELAGLDPKAVDRGDLARALREFDPIWDVLLVPERERIVGLLVERIDMDAGDLEIHWRLDGFGSLVEEMA